MYQVFCTTIVIKIRALEGPNYLMSSWNGMLKIKEAGIVPVSCISAFRLKRCYSLIHRVIDLKVLGHARHIQHLADVGNGARQFNMLCISIR